MTQPSGRPLLNRIGAAIRSRAVDRLDSARVFLRTRHVHGPRRIHLDDSACALVSMMKDAEYFIDDFILHHQRLGVRHVLVIDNGSTDATVARACAHDNVTVVRNTLPVRRYESRLRREIARRHIKGGWLLFMDSDELFELPSRHPRALDLALGHCNDANHTAVVCQCLDFFSGRSLLDTADLPYAAALEAFNLYSLKDIDRVGFHSDRHRFGYFTSRSTCRSGNINLHFGGIRQAMFAENCLLTAIRLVRNIDSAGIYVHPHFSVDVDIADFTALIRHYKFCGNVVAREAEQVAQGTWGHGEDRKRVAQFSRGAGLLIAASDQRPYDGPGSLVAEGFLVLSDGLQKALASDRGPGPG